MPNRLDIELTSHRDDGTWTWRVAGARNPKGAADGAVIPAGAKTGDVLTVEAETDIDGITVVAVLSARTIRDRKGRDGDGAQRIEVLGTRGRDGKFEGVITTLARPERRGSSGGERRNGRPDRDRPDRNKKNNAAREGEAALGERDGRGGRRSRGGPAFGSARDSARGAPRDSARPGSPRAPRGLPADSPAGAGRTTARGDGFRAFRLGDIPSVHRTALLDSLSAEQRAVTDRLVAGGLPAVRKAIDEQNAQAKAAGHPEVPTDPILAMAEAFLPRLKVATWCDRAEAALADLDKLTLRELRTIVNAAEEAGREEPGRSYILKLREAVDVKVAASRTGWEEQITALLDGGQVVRALKASATPPDPGARVSAALAAKLAEAAGSGLTAEVPPPRWMLLLEAAAVSPVRVNVRPLGVPADATPEQLDKARRLAGRVPALAKLLGIAIPPPPAPIVSARPRPRRETGK